MRLLSAPVPALLSKKPLLHAFHLLAQRTPFRLSSLSAIHRGLHRSGNPRLQGSQAPGRDPQVAARVTERRRARLAAPKPTFKIRKGKKDITEYESPTPPTGKSARFYDPEDPFGKGTASYRFKTGQLHDELRFLAKTKRTLNREPTFEQRGKHQAQEWDPLRRPAPPARDGQETSGRRLSTNTSQQNFSPTTWRKEAKHQRDGFTRARNNDTPGRPDRSETFRRSPYSEGGDRESFRRARSNTPGRPDRSENLRRSTYSGGVDREIFTRTRDNNTPGRPERSETFRRSTHSGSDRENFTRGRSSHATGRADRPSSLRRSIGSERAPTPRALESLPFTTAASQFLYGRSVVEAALTSSRRKLYKLYIYGGANRQNVSQDQAIERLAQRQGVETAILKENDQRAMDKMSQGRPHNGIILEASPLPQLPVTGLGDVSSMKDRSGYSIKIGHQSIEERAVNGNDDFVTTQPGKYKPFVLVLDGVQDPGNLGAILRTASFLGVSAVAISKRCSATLTSVALKASAGASETLPLFSVESTTEFLTASKEAGWKIYAAVAPGSRSRQVDLDEVEQSDPLAEDPCILVLGSEGDGLPRQVRSKADFEVCIPNQSGSDVVDSLNVSVAAGLLCASFVKQQTRSFFTFDSKVDVTKDKLRLW